MTDTAIQIENLGKLYRLGQTGTGTLSHDLNRWWARVSGKEDPFSIIGETNSSATKGRSDYVWALKNINFEVKKGEALGIIGANGAGKSTLLKILSKITAPTKGLIKIRGRIASLLEVGTGFHPEMTGRENIFLNGALLGMTKKEINLKFDGIVDFAGVERFIDTPVKRYSSGMYVRLAFAIAAFLEPEILVVDEVLAVGDAEFQKKCLGRMQDLSRSEGRTVLFVSHDLNAVSQLCNTAILLQHGEMKGSGSPREIINSYLSVKSVSGAYINTLDNSSKKLYIKAIHTFNRNELACFNFDYNDPIVIKFDINIQQEIPGTSLFVTVLDSRKRRVFSCEKEGLEKRMVLTIEAMSLVRGNYSLHAFINIPKIQQLDVAEDVCNFSVYDSGSWLSKHGEYDYGPVFGRYSWQ